MTQHPLAEFLDALEHDGQLHRVTAAVDAELEIAEITNRLATSDGPAILFENVRGCRLPTVSNLWGSPRRICQALGVHGIDELVGLLVESRESNRTAGWLRRLRRSTDAVTDQRKTAGKVRSPACQQVVRLGDDVDLTQLPALRCWPGETRRALLTGRILVPAADGDSGSGTYRIEVLDRRLLAIAFSDGDDLEHEISEHERLDRVMPVAIALGGSPRDVALASLSQALHFERGLIDVLRAGQNRGVADAKTIELSVPADADVILEGSIDTSAPAVEMGTDAGACGYYQDQRPGRRIEITAVTERVNPIVPSAVSHAAHGERTVIDEFAARISLPWLQARFPELADYHLASAAGLLGPVFVSVRRRYAGQAMKLAAALWGSDEFQFAKVIILVDEPIDVRDHAQVMLAVGSHVDPATDIHFHSAPAHPADHAARRGGPTDRMVVDATPKRHAESGRRAPRALAMTSEIRDLVTRRWEEYGWSPPPGRQ